MTLDTDKVRMHWSNLSEHLKRTLPSIIENEIRYFVYDTAAAGKCPIADENTLYEILSDMAEWKIQVSYEIYEDFKPLVN